ncbi:MAG: hypothetical protein WDN23_08405 [Edaphobacter sp.]
MRLIKWMKKQFVGSPIGISTRQIAKLISNNLLKSDSVLGRINATANERERLKSRFRVHQPHSLAVPAKQPLKRAKKDTLWSDESLPDVRKIARLYRNLVEERDELQ